MSVRFTSLVAVLCLSAQVSAQEPPPVESPAPVSPVPETPTPDVAPPTAAPPEPTAEVAAPEPTTAASEAAVISAPSDLPSADAPMMSAEELAALGLGGEAPSVDTDLHLSGFVDFGMQFGLTDFSRAVTEAYPSFAVGNINVYLTKNLSESVRTMLEVRVLYLPNGGTAGFGSTAPPMSTLVSDYSDFNRTLRWGGVEVERVYMDWAALNFLTIRAGQFLTPYGVWNVDHGSPTIIPAAKPYVIGVGFFPERQTGIELYGRADLGSTSVVGYNLTFSNGTGSIVEYRDLDSNKAVGARAYWESRALGELRLGGSLYYGRDTQGAAGITITESGLLRPGTTVTTQSDSLAFGFDAVWKVQQLHLQTEWLTLQRKYTESGRRLTAGFTGASMFPADGLSWGMYALAGYRFDWFGIMPFVAFQRMYQPDALDIYGYHFGLNLRPIDALTLKAQLDLVRPSPDGEKIRMLYLQVAWAF